MAATLCQYRPPTWHWAENARFLFFPKTFDPKIKALEERHPQFFTTFLAYLGNALTENFLEEAKKNYYDNKKILDSVEKKYGVPENIIVAIWGGGDTFWYQKRH